MTPEIEARTNRIVSREVLRRGRLLADQATREKRQEEVAWRVLLTGILAIAVSAILVVVGAALFTSLFIPLRSTYQHYFGKKHFYAIRRPPGPAQHFSPKPAEEAYRRGALEKLDQTGNPDSWPMHLSGKDGAVLILLRINPNGSLDRAIIGKNSGPPDLVRRACEIVVAAAPFEPFPKALQGISSMRISSYMVFNYGSAPAESLLPIAEPANRLVRPDWLPAGAEMFSGPDCDASAK